MSDKNDGAISNAKAWYGDIARWHELTHDAYEAAEKFMSEEMSEPLSLQVRSGWQNIGDTLEPGEFEILLSTGGPALRIVGNLDEHREPTEARMQWQDWGTPWTTYHQADEDTLLAYAQNFYWGG
jgi:hypothetical protein